jgi:hypothetical protein
MRYKLFWITLFVVTGSLSAWADAIPVEPGLWEMTSTMSMPMMPQPNVSTRTECIEETEISMDDMGGEDIGPECSSETAQADDSTMQWSFTCPMEGGGTTHGEWQATSYGDRVTGSGKVSMALQGQAMEMTVSWEGRRVGDCP